METIIIGAGLAGSEAALQLAKRNIKVKLLFSILSFFIYPILLKINLGLEIDRNIFK